jgi:hypothetical protein
MERINDFMVNEESEDEVLLEELQRRVRLAEYRGELEKMGQQSLPFEEMAAEEVQNVSKPKSA